jgi:dihydrofolate synthase/folylpolyglutamate synthase
VAVNETLERREFLGWKLGLERMHRLCTLLGMPQHRFASIHVVGTNGKTSVTRMTAAILEAHGERAGAYLSPHIHSWRERIVIGGEPISEEAFADALERAEQSAQVADRSAGEEGPVTQYELLTAAAFVAFAAARVKVAVIEAGLGGRLDATNVIPSKATVLTSVGLDHTDWLGDTLEEIAAEKLAVLRDHTTLIAGRLPAEVEPVVEDVVGARHAERPSPELPPEGYPERNFALAETAAAAALGHELEPEAVERARHELSNPGRAQVIEGDPPAILDAAHNPQGARALAELLPTLSGARPVVCCLAVMEDKDAEGIVAALAPACAALVCAEVPPEAMEGSGRPGARSRPAAELAALCRGAGAEAEAVSDPAAAWSRARELAEARSGVALAAGSHYLLKCL